MLLFSFPGCTPKDIQAINDFIEGEEKVIEQVILDETGISTTTSKLDIAPSDPSPPKPKVVLKKF
jgi:hypothetical protein